MTEKPPGGFLAPAPGRIPRRWSALLVSASAHALLFGLIALAWPRANAPAPSNTANTASFTRDATPSARDRSASTGNFAESPSGDQNAEAPSRGVKPSSHSAQARGFVWTESYGARVARATPGVGSTRVWLIPAVFEMTRRSIEDDIFNHLWQSTLFALAVGFIAVALRQKAARARYWIWCAASVKFLIPVAALERVGGFFPLASAAPAASTPTTIAILRMAEPFTRTTVSAIGTATVGGALDWLPTALWLVWFFGAEFVVLRRLNAWRRVRAAARDSRPTTLDGLAIPKGVAIRCSATQLEPGTIGIVTPVLLLPSGIDAHLSAAELETVIEHELCHIRCRDNLTAGVQMLIEAVFWFHPLVWWIGARMVDERERACDEHVLAIVENPRTYADAILHICQRYVYAGLATVPGVGGGDLRRRIERIMRKEVGAAVSTRTRAWLAAAGAAAVLLPAGIGAVTTTAQRRVAQPLSPVASISNQRPAFISASVKRNDSGNLMVQFIPDAPGWFTAINAPAALLIRFAYDLPDFAVTGSPDWVNKDRFDVTARVPDNDSVDARRLMLQRLFEERFMLSAHHESRRLPIYAMRLSNRNGALGPRLRRSGADCAGVPMLPLLPGRVAAAEMARDAPCGFFGMSPSTNLPNAAGGLAFRGLTMGALAKAFTTAVHRTVVDQTGLPGYFDGEFDFISELPPPPPPPGLPNPFTAPFSSIFTVVPDQLGLKLDGDRGPVDMLVIDSVQHPTSD